MFNDFITKLEQLKSLYILDEMLEFFDNKSDEPPSEDEFIEKFKEKIEPFDIAFMLNELKDLQSSDKEKDLKTDCCTDKEYSSFEKMLDEQRDYYFHNGLAAWDIIDTIQAYHNDGIDNTEAGYLFCIMKYLLRYPYKGNSSGDLEKAKTYIDRLIDYIKK